MGLSMTQGLLPDGNECLFPTRIPKKGKVFLPIPNDILSIRTVYMKTVLCAPEWIPLIALVNQEKIP